MKWPAVSGLRAISFLAQMCTHTACRSRALDAVGPVGECRAMTSDSEVLGRIGALVDEEHQLRSRAASDDAGSPEEQARLKAVEVELDRCWDLLRQRRARREFGENPDEASPRPAGEVEGYLS